MLVRVSFLLVLMLCCSISVAEEAVEIPLREVWAWRMPGTRPMCASMRNGEYLSTEGHLLDEIRHSLKFSRNRKKAMPGFAVLGVGMEALRQAHKVLVESEKPQASFPRGSDISLVFFAYQSGSYVHIKQIRHEGKTVLIKYAFVPHADRQVTTHIALIPLKGLPVGHISVEIDRSHLGKAPRNQEGRTIDSKWNSLIVCRSFSFCVLQRVNE